MRAFVLTFLAAGCTLAATAATASTFGGAPPLQVAHEDERLDEDRRSAPPPTREELDRRKRELREQERARREIERRDEDSQRDRERVHTERSRERTEHVLSPRFWLGVSAGVGYGNAEVPCQTSTFGYEDCHEEGITNTYAANITLSGPRTALRLRGVRDADKGDERRTPYETAALVGMRMGRSNWYAFAGYGQIHHVDDRFVEDHASGFAWEFVFAPASRAISGFELSISGQSGEEVDWIGTNIGARFGLLE